MAKNKETQFALINFFIVHFYIISIKLKYKNMKYKKAWNKFVLDFSNGPVTFSCKSTGPTAQYKLGVYRKRQRQAETLITIFNIVKYCFMLYTLVFCWRLLLYVPAINLKFLTVLLHVYEHISVLRSRIVQNIRPFLSAAGAEL